MIGSKYEAALREIIQREMEFQLGRQIQGEASFIEACKEYASIEDKLVRPVQIDLHTRKWSCYLCLHPAENPVIVPEGDAKVFSRTAFHQACLDKAVVNYILDRKFRSLGYIWGPHYESANLIRFPSR